VRWDFSPRRKEMALVVQKYGGTSVGTVEKIKNVSKRVAKTKDAGNDVVVVISAMAGETDRLIGLAKAITEVPDEREMDMLLSSGERVSSALLAITLKASGYPARSFTGRQAGFITDGVHTKARIKKIEAGNVMEALKAGEIAVVAGFQGVDELSHDVTTLGRGGSDTTAVALAAGLKGMCVRSIPTWKGSILLTPGLCPMPASWTGYALKRCWRWLAPELKCSRLDLWSLV